MKSIALISGGLDSILAAKLVEQQGIEVIYLNFKIPFCHKDRDGIGNLRERIKIEASKIKNKFPTTNIGVMGYPNTGKSSLINFLFLPC